MLASSAQFAKLVELFKVAGQKQTYKKGEYIIRPGQEAWGVFFIELGLVKVYDVTKYKEENLQVIRKENEIFPLLWALTGNAHPAIYQAINQTTTLRISKNTFHDFIAREPDILAPILDIALEMYRVNGERIVNLEFRTVRERIISYLITLSEHYPTKEIDEGIVIEVPLRHQDIASSINASRETTSRELSALERKGLITTRNSFIVIKDSKALRQFLV
jgi:CRP/FNR family transcriptional regulator